MILLILEAIIHLTFDKVLKLVWFSPQKIEISIFSSETVHNIRFIFNLEDQTKFEENLEINSERYHKCRIFNVNFCKKHHFSFFVLLFCANRCKCM